MTNLEKRAEELKSAFNSFMDTLVEENNYIATASPEVAGTIQNIVEAAESAKPVAKNITVADLEDVTYNDLKKLAKDLGISAKGDRDTLVANITEVIGDKEEPVEKPAKSSKKSTKSKPASEPEEDDEEELEDAPADDLEALVAEAVEDMETEEIAELLSESGISPKGKRQALIDKVVKGVKDGLISLGDDDESDEDEEVDETETEEETVTAPEPEEDDEDMDDEDGEEEEDEEEVFVSPENAPEYSDITDERLLALEELEKKLVQKYMSKKLKATTMLKELKAFSDDESLSKLETEELLERYIDMKKFFIDDNGCTIEPENGYELNGDPYCCGKPLVYNEDDETYICESCGTEYGTSDDE